MSRFVWAFASDARSKEIRKKRQAKERPERQHHRHMNRMIEEEANNVNCSNFPVACHHELRSARAMKSGGLFARVVRCKNLQKVAKSRKPCKTTELSGMRGRKASPRMLRAETSRSPGLGDRL